MAIVKERSVSLPPELAAFVDQAVEGGEFSNASEVILEALRQWKARRDLHGYAVKELRLHWDEGIASGQARTMTESFSDIIKRRGRERLAVRALDGRRKISGKMFQAALR